MSDEYMVVMINGEFSFRRVAERRVRMLRNGAAEFVKQPELMESEILAVTWPPGNIYHIVNNDR